MTAPSPAPTKPMTTPSRLLPVGLGDPSPRPWRRWVARMLDFVMGYALCGILIALILPDLARQLSQAESDWAWYFAATPLYIVLEGLALAIFGATPGKALFGLRVMREDGSAIPFEVALGRALRVWVVGLGLGLPIVSLFTMARAKATLETNHSTSWDQAAGSTVRYVRDGAA
jgi:uncharacterized RDD family membrane protein YckC